MPSAVVSSRAVSPRAPVAASASGYTTTAQIRLDLSQDEVVEAPRLQATDGAFPVRALTDLKRYYLGEHLCDGAKLSTPVDSSFKPLTVPAPAPVRLTSS